MKLYGLWLNEKYEGFGLEESLDQVISDWKDTPVVITHLGDGDAEMIRNLADFFTCLKDGGTATPEQYNIVQEKDGVIQFTLTLAGQTFWDEHLL